MKKLYSFLAISAAFSMNAQNLVQNPSFDAGLASWAAGATTSYYAPSLNATDGNNGTNSAQYIDATATTGFYQNVNAVAGTQYAISFWYKSTNTVNTADIQNARIWSYWLDSTDGLITDTPTAAALRGPNNLYLADVPVWTQYTATVTAPVGTAKLQFAVRTYTGGTTSFDGFSMQDASVLGVSEIGSLQNHVKMNTLIDNNLTILLPMKSTVNIFSVEGKLVSSNRIISGESIDTSAFAKGFYIVTVDNGIEKFSTKIMKK